MEQEKAKKIIDKSGLINGKTGRKILLAIENNELINDADLPAQITKQDVEILTALYQNKLKKINYSKCPRNLIFYHIIKDKYPDFEWEYNEEFSTTQISAPRVNNLRPSLLSFLLEKVDLSSDTLLHRKYQCLTKLPLNLIKEISSFMEKMEFIFPNEDSMKLFVDWLSLGLENKNLSIFSPVCPDYSVEETGDLKCPFRHTFNNLGEGLGPIAQRTLSVHPEFIYFLKQFGIKAKLFVGFGDFEGYSESNLKRLNLTTDEFLSRVSKSRQKYKEMSSVDVAVLMITDMFDGYHGWVEAFNEHLNKLNNGYFGESNLSKESLVQIVEKRKNLYDRWYGEKAALDHVPQLIFQGAEYAALGANISKNLENCLILGADNDAMGPFYSITKKIPTLYLKRYYC